jgi:TPR repeat protein
LAAIQAADLCANGHGTPPDLQRALFWVQAAADRFSPDGFERLQGFYASGLAEQRNLDENPTWLRRQAAVRRAVVFNQNGTASFDLSSSWALVEDCEDLWNRYRFGIGTPPDYIAAAEWMWQAFQVDLSFVATGQGSLSGGNRAIHPFDAILNDSAMPSTADERLWRQAVRVVHEALDLRRPEAWHRIGESYRDGSALTPRQRFYAWSWFARAAEMGHSPARNALKELEAKFTATELAEAKLYWVPPVGKNNL